ncbi:MAG: DUF2868 domain-containing protein [Planctomycetota bacterium]|nr:DUF2868 domain-containing protein [Planctomycetota bacterium]MDA1113192.1 DUF2868 domain-containing protein [Planctomycetota bacterium]
MTELRDFLDAEYALQRDESAWEGAAKKVAASALVQANVSVGEMRQRLSSQPEARRSLVKQWLVTLREQGVPLPGDSMVRAYVGLGGLAIALGAIFGLVAGKTALMTTAGQPINLWLFLGVLVFLQVGLLLAGFVFAAVAKVRGKEWLGLLGRFSQTIFRWKWVKHHAEREMLGALPETSRVEQWIWLGFTQRFAVAFNLGAAISFVALLLFSELQFGWSTTPDSFKSTALESLVDVLAAPWAWAAPESWSPSADFIAGTRWETLEGNFRNPSVDGREWWPFLLMSLLVWGLLPRILLLSWMESRKRKALQSLTWNHRGYQRWVEIMFPLQACSTRTPVDAIEEVTASSTKQSDSRKGILWGAWPLEIGEENLFARHSPLTALHFPSSSLVYAGGQGLEQEADIITQLSGSKLAELWVFVEAGESPDKRLTSFLGKLRQTVGKDCPIHILPLEHHAGQWPAASDRDLEIWTRTLSSLRDRQLSVRRIAAS